MHEEDIKKIKNELEFLIKISEEFGDYKSIWVIIMNLRSRLKFYGIEHG